MNASVKRVLVLLVGWLCILVGIVGLFLPILQGILFIVIGLIVLSSEYAWARHWLEKLRARFPKISHMADEAGAKASALLQRISPSRKSGEN